MKTKEELIALVANEMYHEIDIAEQFGVQTDLPDDKEDARRVCRRMARLAIDAQERIETIESQLNGDTQ